MMKIAQIAPAWKDDSQKISNAIEQTILYLTEELVSRGHSVTLFTPDYFGNNVRLLRHDNPIWSSASSLSIQHRSYAPSQLRNIFNRGYNFDLIHSHVGASALPYANHCSVPVVQTLHRAISSDDEPKFIQHAHHNFVSLSEGRRRTDLRLNYQATIGNAIAVSQFNFYSKPDQPPYLAFVAGMSAEQGPHIAIQIAQKAGLPLKMAGRLDQSNYHFFEKEILPKIDGTQIQFLGEVTQFMKNELMGRALATLCPITWQVPSGFEILESMATGTPVIAAETALSSEVIDHGNTGFLCQSIDDFAKAAYKAAELNRWACRSHVSTQHSIDRMVNDYESLYYKLVSGQQTYQDMPIAS